LKIWGKYLRSEKKSRGETAKGKDFRKYVLSPLREDNLFYIKMFVNFYEFHAFT